MKVIQAMNSNLSRLSLYYYQQCALNLILVKYNGLSKE